MSATDAPAAPARQRFAGRHVVVTGGGRGIGRAVALAFAREGARLTIASRTAVQLHQVAGEVQAGGSPRPLCVPLDISRAEQVRAGVDEIVRRNGPVDVLVNCAGVFAMGPSESIDEAELRTVLDTNTVGTMLMCQAVGRSMLDRGSGRIVNFASLLSFTAFPGRAAYAASKGAVLQLTRVLGVEWAGRGVTVNAVAPGMIQIETPHPALAEGDLRGNEFLRRIPIGRRGRPDDITGPVLFLASDEAAYVTGQTLVVDGGWLSYGYL
ncbi:SDR family oxidoreductase [Dactylosporangium sp. NPDC050688]|uniref:SDR family NAD(P)-dependent oxidoreductase n=1 Tax=Dactylosporangium sp. NPDC050688 TaxID=3157217 RepID=UPI00340C8799